MPEATTPTAPAPEMTLKGELSARSRRVSSRASRRRCMGRAKAGMGTKREAFFWKPAGAGSTTGSARVTGPRRWFTRVVVRRSTGAPSSRARASAAAVMSLASWAVAGSRQGSPARRA